MQYSTGKHCVFYHRYHLVWSTKYRFKVLQGKIKFRVRDICRQVCAENGVDIIHGVLSSDHVHMFVSVPPKLAISDLMRLMKGRSSHKVQREFPALKKALLGSTLLGARVLLNHQRCHHRGRLTSVLGEAYQKSYRRQSVVV
jgi:putative transposase